MHNERKKKHKLSRVFKEIRLMKATVIKDRRKSQQLKGENVIKREKCNEELQISSSHKGSCFSFESAPLIFMLKYTFEIEEGRA